MHREIDVARLIQQDRANEQIVLAWRMEQIRMLTDTYLPDGRIQKRLPDLSTLLVLDEAPSLAQTVETKRSEQRAAWIAFAQYYGVTVRTKVH